MFKKTSKKDQMVKARQKRLANTQTSISSTTNPNTVILDHKGIFLITCILTIIICFAAQAPKLQNLNIGQVARNSTIAVFNFSYKSNILTNDLIRERKEMTAPVYRVKMENYAEFGEKLQSFSNFLDEIENSITADKDDELISDLADAYQQQITDEFGIEINNTDIETLLSLPPSSRQALLSEGETTLKDILQKGVYGESFNSSIGGAATPYIVSVETNDSSGSKNIQSEERAQRRLAFEFASIDTTPEISQVLLKIFKGGLNPNLTYDHEGSQLRLSEVEKQVPPVIVNISKGQIIVEAGDKVSDEQAEQLYAYHNEIEQSESYGNRIQTQFTRNILITLCIFIATLIAANMGLPRLDKPARQIRLISTVLIANLIVLRLIQETDQLSVIQKLELLELIPYAAPIALGAILTVIFVNTQAGIHIAILLCTLHTLMYGETVGSLLFLLPAPIAGVYMCRKVRSRRVILQASLVTGVITAASALTSGLIDNIPFAIISKQAGVALATGLFSGITVICLIPLLERIFKITTNITLHELADFNHQLLRQMQLIAPGTYHHSLMVANLAERAATAVKANEIMCRTCSLYHDIGKTVKPEYFTENQVDGVNPHMDQNPSMSALVIKSHVKEGVNMAKEANLPPVIIDTIEQHHGTGLIWYFYHRAKKKNEDIKITQQAEPDSEVDESTYRYDGPKPQTRENAIILLADSVEAASRSLKKTSASSIEELVDKIFKSHIDDGQLNESPITLGQLDTIKKTFVVALLNTLHHRTEYPEREATREEPKAKSSEPETKSTAKEKQDSEKEEEPEKAI